MPMWGMTVVTMYLHVPSRLGLNAPEDIYFPFSWKKSNISRSGKSGFPDGGKEWEGASRVKYRIVCVEEGHTVNMKWVQDYCGVGYVHEKPCRPESIN